MEVASNIPRLLNSIIHLGSHCAGFDEEDEDDEDDPNVTITFSSDDEIHQAMALPGHPLNLTPGHNAQDSEKKVGGMD